MKKIKKVSSEDNIEFTIQIVENVVPLTSQQLHSIEKMIQTAEAEKIIEEGITIKNLPHHQGVQVIQYLKEIVKDFSIGELLDEEIIDFTTHAIERMSDEQICIDRRWTPENAEHEIAECIKRAYGVEQIRLRFDSQTKASWENLAFKIKGSIGKDEKRRDGELVIYFDKDPIEDIDSILVITILTPEY